MCAMTMRLYYRPTFLTILYLLLLLSLMCSVAVASRSSSLDAAEDMLRQNIPDMIQSPEWIPFYQRLLDTPSLKELLSSSSSNRPEDNNGRQERRQQQEQVEDDPMTSITVDDIPCNEILDTIPLSDLIDIMTEIVTALVPDGGVERFFLQSLLVDNVKTGLHVVQVCGSCTDSIPTENLNAHDDYCGTDIYGADHLHSGLLLIPLDDIEDENGLQDNNNTPRILPGTHAGYIAMPTTRVSVTEMPNLLWLGRNDTSPVLWLYMVQASAQQMVLLAPHTMGYGKSSDLFKSYIVRKGYETSIIPLWYQAQTLVQEWSGGCSALGNAAVATGYSEGGYSSVVVAHALRQNAGVNILRVHSGAGPYRVSSEAPLGVIEGIDAGIFPVEQGGDVLLALLGVTYSSTYPHLANHNVSSQYILADDTTRDALVGALSGRRVQDHESIPILVEELIVSNGGEVLDLYRDSFIAAARQFIANNTRDACTTFSDDVLQEYDMDFLCQALIDNDLTDVLETQVDYPVEFCHSPNDEIVIIENLPNLTANPQYLSRIPGITGTHYAAAEACFLQELQTSILSSDSGTLYDLEPLHNPEECVTNSRTVDDNEGDGGPSDTTTEPDEANSSSISVLLMCLLLAVAVIWI